MAKYRGKPFEIEAFRFGHDDVPEWFKESLKSGVAAATLKPNSDIVSLYAIEVDIGILHAFPGDYIIKDYSGMVYCCGAEHFESRYERVLDEKKNAKVPAAGADNKTNFNRPGRVVQHR